jgi:hypothetical protein
MKIHFLIKLKYKGKTYEINYPVEEKYVAGTRFLWEEGNYACDCNRSIFIRRQCDKNFKEMDCGEKIELVSIARK